VVLSDIIADQRLERFDIARRVPGGLPSSSTSIWRNRPAFAAEELGE
jgi:hypothetical protein